MKTQPRTPVAPPPPPTTLPFRKIFSVTVLGGAGVAILSSLFGHRDFGGGALAGAFLAGGGLFSLKATLRRVLASSPSAGKRNFYAAQAVRWLVWIAVLYGLLRVSPACLIGAAVSYLWFLGVLSFYGLQSAKGETSTDPKDPGSTQAKTVR